MRIYIGIFIARGQRIKWLEHVAKMEDERMGEMGIDGKNIRKKVKRKTNKWLQAMKEVLKEIGISD